MTYPQPSSTQPVLNGQQFFRLTTPIVSAGDIYESEVSALAFALGPNSDLATILLTYLDENSNVTGVSQATISPDRSLVGRIDARNEIQYPGPGARKGRILISIDDIWDARWRPTGFDASDQIAFEQPVLDVIQYFTGAPSLIPQRSDRIFRYQYFAIPGGVAPQSTWVVVPAYGRKSGYFTFLNGDPIQPITAKVHGVKLSTSASPGPVGYFQQQLFSQVLVANANDTYTYLASVDGIWDLFAVELLGYLGQAAPTTITLSDDAL